MSVLISGGRVVTAADDYVADVSSRASTAVGSAVARWPPTTRSIDAAGKYVLPGCVDPHTHLDMPFGGTVTIDDVESGQTAAAFGGTTCHVDFCIQEQGQTLRRRARRLAREGRRQADDRHGLPHRRHRPHARRARSRSSRRCPSGASPPTSSSWPTRARSWSTTRRSSRTMEVAARTGALVMVHAENGDVIDVLVRQALAAGHTEPRWHALTRPPETEGEATNRAIQLAHIAGSPLYVVHVSCREAVEPIAAARAKGWNVWGETCTQYFFVDETFLERPDFEGAKYVYTPPPRDKANQDVLWRAVPDDVLSVDLDRPLRVFNWEGQKTLGRDDFSKIPNGGPGLENRLQMIHHFGVRGGPDHAQPDGRAARDEPGEALRPLPAQGDARGRLRRRHRRLRPREAAAPERRDAPLRVDYNLYEGTEVVGSPEIVLLRGDGRRGRRARPRPRIGRYVPRARFARQPVERFTAV